MVCYLTGRATYVTSSVASVVVGVIHLIVGASAHGASIPVIRSIALKRGIIVGYASFLTAGVARGVTRVVVGVILLRVSICALAHGARVPMMSFTALKRGEIVSDLSDFATLVADRVTGIIVCMSALATGCKAECHHNCQKARDKDSVECFFHVIFLH